MKAKQIVTILLLVFVAASVAALIMKGSDGRSAAEKTHDGDTKIIAYYFHGNARCKTCLTIELYALEAIEAGFPEALESGEIEFLPVNLEIPENEHFIDDFQLAARTIVLERIVDGERKDYLNLHRVWELVKDREAYVTYVQDETGKFMNGES